LSEGRPWGKITTSIEGVKKQTVETSIKGASALMDIGVASTEREF
jgi:hypothetical protein